MKILLVHVSSPRYSEVYLRLEPLGLEVLAYSRGAIDCVIQGPDY